MAAWCIKWSKWSVGNCLCFELHKQSKKKKVGKKFYTKSLKQQETGGTPFKKVCELILFLGSKYSDGIRGKLISILWDDWKNWINYKHFLQDSDVYTLRRIVGKDRDFEWGDK